MRTSRIEAFRGTGEGRVPIVIPSKFEQVKPPRRSERSAVPVYPALQLQILLCEVHSQDE